MRLLACFFVCRTACSTPSRPLMCATTASTMKSSLSGVRGALGSAIAGGSRGRG